MPEGSIDVGWLVIVTHTESQGIGDPAVHDGCLRLVSMYMYVCLTEVLMWHVPEGIASK